jgi:chaperone BCS1
MYQEFLSIVKEYPWLAGIFSLYGLSMGTYLLRFVPNAFHKIQDQFIISLEFNNTGYYGAHQFKSFMTWFLESKWSKWSRHLCLTEDPITDRHVTGPGYGQHFFFFKGRLFWFFKSKLPSEGTDKEKESIVIYTFGRNHQYLFDLIEAFAYKPVADNERYVYTRDKDYWKRRMRTTNRPLKSVVINHEIKSSIQKNIEFFKENEEWYVKRGLNYKQTYLFHGRPGTGKTSLIKSLASYYNKNLCVLDLNNCTNNSFESALMEIPKDAIIVIEDIDSSNATKERGSDSEENYFLSLGTILNTLDGVISLNNTLIFLTTNHPEKLDPALVRKGRIDYIYEIPYLSNKEIKEYINLVYPDENVDKYDFQDIAGCNIQSLFLEHKDDFNSFIYHLTKN